METEDVLIPFFGYFAQPVYGVNWDNNIGCEKHSNCLQKAKEVIMEMFKYSSLKDGNGIQFDNALEEFNDMSCYRNQWRETPDYLHMKSESEEKSYPIAYYYKIVDEFKIPENVLLSGVKGDIPLWMLQMNIMLGWLIQFFGNDSAYDNVKKAVCKSFKALLPAKHEKIYEELIITEACQKKPFFFKTQEPRFTESPLNDYSFSDVPLPTTFDINDSIFFKLDRNRYVFDYSQLKKGEEEKEETFERKLGRIHNFLVDNSTDQLAMDFYSTLYPDAGGTLQHYHHYRSTTPKQFVIRSFRDINNVPEAMVIVDEALNVLEYALSHRLQNELYDSVLLKKALDNEAENWGTTNTRADNFMTISDFSRLLEKFDLDKSRFSVVPDMMYAVNRANVNRDITKPLTFMNSIGVMVMDSVEVVFQIFRSIVTGVNSNITDEGVLHFKLHFMCRIHDENSGLCKESDVNQEIQALKNKEVYICDSKRDYFFKNNQIYDIISMQQFNEKLAMFGLPELQYSDEFSSLKKYEAELYMIVAWMCFVYDKDLVAQLPAKNLEAVQPMKLMQGIMRRVPLSEREQFKDKMTKLLTVWDRLDFIELLSTPNHHVTKKAIVKMDDVKDVFPEYELSDMELIKDEKFGIMGWFTDGKKITITSLQMEEKGRKKIILDEVDCAREDVPESALDNLSSYLSFFPDKKIYIRSTSHGSLDLSMVVADDLIEVIPAIARQQNLRIEEISDKLAISQRRWGIGSEGNLKKLYTSDMDEIFGELGLRKDLLTIVPDICQRQVLNDHITKNSNIMDLTDLSGNPLISPIFAIYNFFRECVLGLNWRTNKCKIHADCDLQCKNKILDVMRKWSQINFTGSLLRMEEVEKEIKVLKEENCYMKLQSKHDDYFFRSYKFDENAPLTAYTSITQMFDLPKCRTVMSEYPAYLMRAWCLAGWMFQFFGVDDDGGMRYLKKAVLDGIAYLIPEKNRKAMKLVFEIESFSPKLFKYDGERDHQGNEAKTMSVAEKRELRNLAIQQRKKQQKNGNQTIATKNTGKKNSMTRLKEYYASKVHEMFLEASADVTDWTFLIKKERYQSSYKTIRNRDSDSAPLIKYFPINLNKYQLAHDMGVLTGADWVDNKKNFSSLSEFMRATGVDTIVLRSFLWGFHPNILNRDDIRFISNEVFEVIEVAMEMQKIPKEKYFLALTACYGSISASDNFHNTMTLQQFENYLDYFDIDKSPITIIPDMIQRRTACYAVHDFSLPITTLDSDGCEVMTMEESILHMFRKLVFGVNWETVAETKGIETVHNFKQMLIRTMRNPCDEYEDCFAKRGCIEEMIEKFREHEDFKEIVSVDMDTIMDGRECQSEISVRDFNRMCDMYSLPRLPSSLGYQKLSMIQARVFLAVAWACDFYDTKVEGIRAATVEELRNCILDGLCVRVPQDMRDQYEKDVDLLWPYWVTGESTDEVVVNDIFELDTKTTIEKKGNTTDSEKTSSTSVDAVSKGASESSKKPRKKKKKRSPEPTAVPEVTDASKETTQDSPPASEANNELSPATEAPAATERLSKNLLTASEVSDSPSPVQNAPITDELPSKDCSFVPPIEKESEIRNTSPGRQEPEEEPGSEDRLTTELTLEESELEKYRKKCSELEAALEAARTKADRYELRAKRTDEAEKANREMMEKVGRVEKLEAELEKANAEIEKLEARWAKWKDRDGKKLEEARKKHEKSITEMQQTIKDMQAESDVVTQELKMYTKNLKKEQEKLKETEVNLNEKAARCLHMEQEMIDMKGGYERMKKQLLDNATQMEVQIRDAQWEAAKKEGEAEEKVIAAENNARRLAQELERKRQELADAKRDGQNFMDKSLFAELINLRRTRLYLEERIESLQRGNDKANGKPPQSQEENEKDAVRYCDRLETIRLNFERSLEMIALRDRITSLKNLTNSDEVKAVADAESAILEKTVTVQVGILELNIMRAQNGENLLNCYPLPPYPTLSEKFERAVQEEANEPVLNEETECGYCYKIRRDSEPQMTCPNEKCPIIYHSVCIKPVIAKKPICPYCKCDFLDPDEFPPPSTSS